MMAGSGGGNASFRTSRAMPDLLSTTFLIAALVAIGAGMVRGFTGFGAAMVMTPAFSALFGPAVGISVCLMLEVAVVLPILPKVVSIVDWRRIGLFLLAAVAGVPLGNRTLTQLDPTPLRWTISAIVLGAVFLLASGWRYHGKPYLSATLATGAASGFLNGLSGMAGPPIVFYYLAGTDPAARTRANLTTYFLFVDLATLAVFAGRGLIGWQTGLLGLCLAPAVVIGGLLGHWLFPLASEVFYRRLALVVLALVAIGALIL
jgi:uncharacterized membrane protein YfcA